MEYYIMKDIHNHESSERTNLTGRVNKCEFGKNQAILNQ
jgi:hypothetical protein